MGMAASQARMLALLARQHNVEFEGQQINQQRLVLSNKMNEIQDRMYDMDVPTPPSKQDFMYNVYSGKTRNGKSVSAKMNDDGSFDVTKTVTGDIVQDAGLGNITTGVSLTLATVDIPEEATDEEKIAKAKESGYLGNASEKKAYPVKGMSDDQILSYIKNGFVILKSNSNGEVYQDATYPSDKVSVNGCATITVADALTKEEFTSNNAFNKAIAGLEQSFPGQKDQFTVIISQDFKAFSFFRTDDLNTNGTNKSIEDNGKVRVYTHTVGEYEDTIEGVTEDNILFDDRGYVSSINLPNGETVKMSVTQEVDEIKYDIAMNKYNIEKIEYDKEQNELNKKTSIYQREDKQLELKLTRLDTERNALNTEIESVKKVIQDATESGFKTFSG